RGEQPDYWNKPVPASGPRSNLLIVGLAPGRHGANRTGIPFTGDASGDLLFESLDALGLTGRVNITNAVKCLPVQNRPTAAEVDNCQPWLRDEIQALIDGPGVPVMLCLGLVAHNAVLKVLEYPRSRFPFAHAATHRLGDDGLRMVDSYHCSRYNTQTGRLTPKMFRQALRKAGRLAELI
ncbi:MAG: uracil-DNA glycosylase, partial [Pseudomonadales bacterium]|nr:uracil-DNA glycosylase [Pseudomonadales bacterium]